MTCLWRTSIVWRITMLSFALLLRPGGYSTGSWRLAGSRVEEATELSLYIDLARQAEAEGIDAIFMADALSLYPSPGDHLAQPLEPVTLLSALAAVTDRIGLIGTISTTYTEPYNIARQLASLDHLSAGRAGWNVVTTAAGDEVARNFGRDRHLAHATRYARADEYQDAVKRLWLSWDADAVDIDRTAGRHTRQDSIHAVDFVGEHLSVAGPLNVPRSPQEWPLLAHAGQSPDGLAVAYKHAELLFSVQQEAESAARFAAGIRAGLRNHGRPGDGLRILPGLIPIVADTEAEALALDRELRELGGVEDTRGELSWVLGFDVATADPDRVVGPDELVSPDDIQGPQSWYRQVHEAVTERPQTVREIRARFDTAGRSGHLKVVGSPEQVADELARWHDVGAAHGFVVQPPVVPQSTDAFYSSVLPLLRERGYLSAPDAGPTLRERLGLPPIRENFPAFFAQEVRA
jgi:N-acetyl-S-(2-succino)cysteine monooxygenase